MENFNKELAKEFDKIGVEYKLAKIPPEKQGTPEDWVKIEQKTELYGQENQQMLDRSEYFVRNNSLPC